MEPIHLYISLLVTTVVAAVGWCVAHSFTSRRDLANKRRELRTVFLLEAYRRLESAAHRTQTDDTVKAIESALGDIQLLGSVEMCQLVQPYVDALNADPNTSPGPLLSLLRRELRRELQLPELQDGGIIARINVN